MRPLSPNFAILLLAASMVAQVPTGTTTVLVRTTGAFQSQLLVVDGSGAVAPCGRFPSDPLPPLAVEVDPIDRCVLVALDLGSGTSRVVRLLSASSTTFAGELHVADLPGRCEQLAVVGDNLLAVLGGSTGGIWRLPRRGGSPTVAFAQANASALHTFGSSGIVVLGWSGSPGTPANDPGLVHADTTNGQTVYGPFPFPNLPGRTLTGLVDLPTALSRQLVCFHDGTFALHVGGLGNPTPLPMTPAPPPGGAVAMKADGYGTAGLVLGGAAHPFLYRADAFAATTTIVAGPLPGDPVDLAAPLPAGAQVLEFETACGVPGLQLVNLLGGLPQLGNTMFDLRVGNVTASSGVFFVAGFRDAAAGASPLPTTLPGGCDLHVSPDAVSFHLASSSGYARVALPIPSDPSFAGLMLFAQWLQPLPNGFAASAATALQIGP